MTVYDNIRNNNLKTYLLLLSYPIALGIVTYASYYILLMYTSLRYPELHNVISQANIMKIALILIIIAVPTSILTTLFLFHRGDTPFEDVVILNSDTEENEKRRGKVIKILEHISITAGISCPRLLIYPSTAMNALATGVDINYSTIILTSGIIDNLKNDELEAIIAHEVAHIANGDTRLMMLINTHIAMITGKMSINKSIGNVIATIVLLPLLPAIFCATPILLLLYSLAISRKKELVADSTAVLYTRNPTALVEALIIVSSNSAVEDFKSITISSLCITMPYDEPSFMQNALNTHPSIEERVDAIRRGTYSVTY